MAVILALGALPPRWPDWVRVFGIPILLAGIAVFVWAARTLGSSFTPYPRPLQEGALVEDGPYRYVRHPVYGAGVLVLLGYGLLTSVVATGAVPAIAVLWWLKSSVEERHLAARFPAYDDYKRRVRRRIL
jgi:protein-S-isoprenylcysteine O-methyltransferase Ste14